MADKVYVNRDVLRELIKDTGRTYEELAQEMGSGKSSLSARISEGYIRNIDAVYLESVYNIYREDYEVEAPAEADKPLTKKDVYDAVMSALCDLDKSLNNNIFGGVYGAIKKAHQEGML